MKKNCSKRSSVFVAITLLVFGVFLFSIAPVHAAPLKFAVISDSHIYQKNAGTMLDAIIKEIRAINASSATPVKYIIVNGDMVFNHAKYGPQEPDSYAMYLEKFFGIITGLLKKTDIKLIMGRGNHDNHYTDDGDHVPYDAKYRAILQKNKNILAVVHDKDEPNYHYVDGDVSFVMLSMVSIATNDKREGSADITWLNFLKKDTKKHTFVVAHYPPFSANSKSYSMKNTSALLDCMAQNGYQYYIAGHDHSFTHSILEKKDSGGKVVSAITQVVCPTSAGGFFPRLWKGTLFSSNPGEWTSRLVANDATFNEKSPGFIIVDVMGDNVGVTAYKMNFDKAYQGKLN